MLAEDGFAIGPAICYGSGMKTRSALRPAAGFALVFAMLSLVFAGCQTTPKVDWNSRVGNFTYDQAVEELGPPDKSATLSDGTTVAEWIKRSSGGVSFGFGTGFYGGGTGVGMGQTVGTGYGDKVLRLVFGPDKKLVSWSKNY